MSDKRKHQQQGRDKNDDCIMAATHQSTTTDLVAENDSNLPVTSIGIIQEKSINGIINNTTYTHQINKDIQHQTLTQP